MCVYVYVCDLPVLLYGILSKMNSILDCRHIRVLVQLCLRVRERLCVYVCVYCVLCMCVCIVYVCMCVRLQSQDLPPQLPAVPSKVLIGRTP